MSCACSTIWKPEQRDGKKVAFSENIKIQRLDDITKSYILKLRSWRHYICSELLQPALRIYWDCRIGIKFDKILTYRAQTIFRVKFIINIIPEWYATAAKAFNEHSEQKVFPAVMHYWRYWSDTVTTTTCRQTTLSANMSPYKSLVKKGSRSVCEKYTSVKARITSVGRRSLRSDIFIFWCHLGLEPKKCRKLKIGFQHHLRRESSSLCNRVRI